MIVVGRNPECCSDPHIHMAMVETGPCRMIDPTEYLPKWVQEYDHFILVWRVSSDNISYIIRFVSERYKLNYVVSVCQANDAANQQKMSF